MSHLFKRADPGMDEAKIVRSLLPGVKEQHFAGLIHKPPITVDEFIIEAAIIERELQQWFRQYDRQASVAAVLLFTCGQDLLALLELVWSVVCKELSSKKFVPLLLTLCDDSG